MGFNDLLGRQISFDILKNALKYNRLSPSLLFHGHSSCGKMTTALSIAKTLNCIKNNNDFCDDCESCYKINSFAHPDVKIVNTDYVFDKINLLYPYFAEKPNIALLDSLIYYINDLCYRYSSGFFRLRTKTNISKQLRSKVQEKIFKNKAFLAGVRKELSWGTVSEESQKRFSKIIDFSKEINDSLILDNIPIETIRTTLNKLYMSPVEGHKVFIVNGADLMREETANTLLKLLEEPPSNSTIILITENLDSILATIKSRCFLVPFYRLSHSDNLAIIRDRFGIVINNSIQDTLWSYLLKEDSLKYSDIVNKFFHEIVSNYLTSSDFIELCDYIASEELYEFFYSLIRLF